MTAIVFALRARRPVFVDGKRYESINSASRILEIPKSTLSNALRDGYRCRGMVVRYADEPPPCLCCGARWSAREAARALRFEAKQEGWL